VIFCLIEAIILAQWGSAVNLFAIRSRTHRLAIEASAGY